MRHQSKSILRSFAFFTFCLIAAMGSPPSFAAIPVHSHSNPKEAASTLGLFWISPSGTHWYGPVLEVNEDSQDFSNETLKEMTFSQAYETCKKQGLSLPSESLDFQALQEYTGAPSSYKIDALPYFYGHIFWTTRSTRFFNGTLGTLTSILGARLGSVLCVDSNE